MLTLMNCAPKVRQKTFGAQFIFYTDLFSFKSNRDPSGFGFSQYLLYIYSLFNQTATYALYLLVKVHIKRFWGLMEAADVWTFLQRY